MSDVRPFHGVHYNLSLLHDWTRVLCPVYDIIPAGQQEELYRKSDYNFVRLEAGRELPQDTPGDNKYTRAAATFNEWLSKRVLETDLMPAIYIHDHYFIFGRKQYTRRGLIARVRLEEWEKAIIRPHESTLSEPKTDRLSLLWAIQANTSSILSLYEDEEHEVANALAAEEKGQPLIDLKPVDGEAHRVRAITDPIAIGKISSHMEKRPLYVADGHHRYESALNYRRQRRASANAPGDQPFDFVMMTLVEVSDPGLLILPTHRLVRGIPRPVLRDAKARLGAFFGIEEHSVDEPGLWNYLDERSRGPDDNRLVVVGPGRAQVLILRLNDVRAVATMMPQFHSDLYRRLEVSIIDHAILEELLGLSPDKDGVNLGFTYDSEDAVKRVASGEFQLAFLVKPIRPSVVKAIADVGDKMPKKSTYFYPKVPAGLILSRLA